MTGLHNTLRHCAAFFAALALLAFPAYSAHADTPLTPIQLSVGGKIVPCSVSPVTDGTNAFVPLDALEALGMRGHLDRKGDAVEVTYGHPVQHTELGLARPDGAPMLSLNDLAGLVKCRVMLVGRIGRDGKPVEGSQPRTACVLAPISHILIRQGALRFHTALSIPYNVHMLTEDGVMVGYVDCKGAYVDESLEGKEFPDDNAGTSHLRAGQFEYDTARIAVDLSPGLHLRVGDGVSDATGDALTVVWGTPMQAPPASIAANVQMPEQPGLPSKSPGSKSASAAVNTPPMPSANQNPMPPNTPASMPPNGQNPMPNSQNAMPPVAAGMPLQIQRIQFDPDSDTQATLHLYTSGPAQPHVSYLEGGDLAIDFAGAALQLTNTEDANLNPNHPLLTDLHAEALVGSPAGVRITLESPRFDSFTVETYPDRVDIILSLPHHATGALAGKLIVIDPGHGGKDTGASGGGFYEKNMVLAIGLKLRRALENAGARVVMTRDTDVFIPLDGRPGLANSIHADLFVSIHNDASSSPGSGTGTTTYYHMNDPSSRALANSVQQSIAAVSGLTSRGARSDSSLYQHGLAVLRGSKMPAILVEVAFIDNAHDRSKLTNPDFQRTIADAIVSGLRTYVEGHAQAAFAGPLRIGF